MKIPTGVGNALEKHPAVASGAYNRFSFNPRALQGATKREKA
jgi:hypothetical protein